MLINTVILFIRDTLPVFLLVSFLLAQPSRRYLEAVVKSAASAVSQQPQRIEH